MSQYDLVVIGAGSGGVRALGECQQVLVQKSLSKIDILVAPA